VRSYFEFYNNWIGLKSSKSIEDVGIFVIQRKKIQENLII